MTNLMQEYIIKWKHFIKFLRPYNLDKEDTRKSFKTYYYLGVY